MLGGIIMHIVLGLIVIVIGIIIIIVSGSGKK